MLAEGFAAVPNWIIRDQRFSRRAILVYISLASRAGPGGIFPSQKTLAEEVGISERTVRVALAELEELGVIERVRRHSSSRGKSSRLPDGYVLLPNGKLPAEVADSNGKLPAKTDEATGKNRHSTPYIEEEPDKKNPINTLDAREAAADVVKDAFAEFWAAYPRRVAKRAASVAFERAVARAGDGGAATIVAAARRFADGPLPEAKFVPHPATWLNGDRWEDDPQPAQYGAERATEAFAMAERVAAREASFSAVSGALSASGGGGRAGE